MAYTTRTQISDEVNNYYDRVLLERLLPNFVYTMFAQIRDIPRKSGSNTIKFRRYGSLSAATTALTEGVTPDGSQLSVTDVTADTSQYGDYVTLTDTVQMETPDPILTETAEVLGEQAKDTLDQLCRDVLAAGTSVQYSDGVAGRSSVSANIDAAEVEKAVRTLQQNDAKKIKKIVKADERYNTSPINASYVGICSPSTLYDLKSATGWIPVEEYANKADVMPGEVGALDDVRFIMTSNAKIFSSAGSGSVDVHATIVLGSNAYGISRISGESLKNIVKPLGSGGTADPLNQRTTSGWKATFVAKIIQQLAMVRIEHAVS